ncbi:MAG: hypothetical protein K0Q47_1465 [Sedimentibacter sp.]|nr:hypothetical protein [Sedimentibacter sp.]
MKKAWELAYDIYSNAKPSVLSSEEQGWGALKELVKQCSGFRGSRKNNGSFHTSIRKQRI